MPWQPNISKWYDHENYDIKKPLWQRMLDVSSHHGDVRRLIEILSWFGQKNKHGDYYKILLIGCFLYAAGVNLEEYVDTMMLSDIVELAEKGNTIEACAINLLKKEHVDEEFIDEFRMQFTKKN